MRFRACDCNDNHRPVATNGGEYFIRTYLLYKKAPDVIPDVNQTNLTYTSLGTHPDCIQIKYRYMNLSKTTFK